MIGNLDMDGLRAFVAIVDSMSFSRAGETIGRSQSAISLRLRRLEKSLGVSLLTRRQGRVIELTASGATLLAYARKIVALNDAAMRDITEKPLGGRIRLGLPADFLDIGFPQALAACRALLGDLQWEIETDVSERLRGRCLTGDLDLAFYKLAAPVGVGTPLGRFRLEWRGRPGMTFDPSEGLPLVCFPEGCVYRRLMQQALRQAGISHHIVFTTPSMDSLLKAVESGMGLTALPVHGGSPGLLPGLPDLGDVALAMVVTPAGDPLVQRAADSLAAALIPLTGQGGVTAGA